MILTSYNYFLRLNKSLRAAKPMDLGKSMEIIVDRTGQEMKDLQEKYH
jgi:hypothetical protein